MLLKTAVIFLMLVGLFCTFMPRIPGTAVILLAALIYCALSGNEITATWEWWTLLILVAAAEFGGRFLRYYFTSKYPISRNMSVNSMLTNLGGTLVADALLGPVLGLVLWEFVAGPTLENRIKIIFNIVLRLFLTAFFRFCCGVIMILIIVSYVFR